MIGILRNLIEREFSNGVGARSISNRTVGLQFHWSIIKEFCGGRQYLSDERDSIIGFHCFDLDVHIHVACAKQELAGRCGDASNTSEHWLIEGIEYERSNDLSQSTDFRLLNRLEQVHTPLNGGSGWLKGRIHVQSCQ